MGSRLPVSTTREEFALHAVQSAGILAPIARTYAESGNRVAALACAWYADVSTLQGALAGIVLATEAVPQRRYFQSAAAALTELGTPWLAAGERLADALHAAREGVARAVDPAVTADLSDRWIDLSVYGDAKVPSLAECEAAVRARLGDVPVETFVRTRRQQAAQHALASAQARAAGDTQGAIHEAYVADMVTLEAYLVESARAAGDTFLLTVQPRWDLVSAQITQLAGLPEEPNAAVRSLRRAMTRALGPVEGARLQYWLV